MTVTNKQVIRLKQMIKQHTQEIAAAKSGMATKTARKYLKTTKLPSELKKQRTWKTRTNVFDKIWPKIEVMLVNNPGLQAKTILEYLIKQSPETYTNKHERTLQRLVKNWRVFNGQDKDIIFTQKLKPGKQSQSDYTSMNKLDITIEGSSFKHLLFHFILPYSRWEHVSICYTESFASLSKGYEEAVWELGFIAQEHRTDNLSAAYKNNKKTGKEITDNWSSFMKHYGVTPTSNNPGISHENGSIEKKS